MEDEQHRESRMSRWSKRKLAVAKEEAAEESAVDETEAEAARLEEEARLLANREAAEAVDLETLNEESDFSVFMKDGVPDLLKKQAMAILWRSNPIFANVDGLVDYDDDFGSPDLIMKTFKSAYQAGRGYLDLFKEDEETETAALDGADMAEEEASTDVPEEGNEETLDEQTTMDTADAEPATDKEAVLADDIVGEGESEEPEPVRMVSLRKRLELEL